MQIIPFLPHYQLVCNNFDFSSFSLISCTAKLQLFTAKEENGEWVKDKSGPAVTLVFDRNATGIAHVAEAEKTVSYNVYDAQGCLVGKNLSTLKGLRKGTYVVRKVGVNGMVSTSKHVIP